MERVGLQMKRVKAVKLLEVLIIFELILGCQAVDCTALNLDSFNEHINNVQNDIIDSIQSYKIEVDNIYQNPELPNGCEIVSGAILLKHLGYDISKTDLADNYLVKSSGWYKSDPSYEYMGNPRKSSGADCGFYVWQGPVIDACNSYIEDHAEYVESKEINEEYHFYDIQGCTFENLLKVIKSDRPVAVWVTIGFVEPSYHNYSWVSNYGNYIQVRKNVHCMVLNGFDLSDESGEAVVYVTDPLGINKTVSIERFKYVWETMGSRAFTYEIANS